MSRLTRPGSAAARQRLTSIALLASFALFAARLFSLVDRHAVDLLFRDQWNLVAPKFAGRGVWAMIRLQHGPPRQGIGGLWIDAIYTLTRWNVRTDCFLTAALMVATAALAVDVKRRLAGGLDAFDAALPPLFLGLASFELFAVTPNAAHGALPLFLAVAGAWALARDRWTVFALVGVAASHTGFATYLAAVAAGLCVLVAIRQRSARPLLASAAIAAAVAYFFVGYQFTPALECFEFPHPRPPEYLYFLGFYLMRPFASFPTAGAGWHAAGGLAASGALVLGAVSVVATFRSTARAREWRIAALLIWFSIAFGIACAVGRVCTGLGGALTSRYVPHALPFWFAVYLLLRRASSAAGARSTAVASLLLLAFCAKEVDPTVNESTARSYSEPKRQWRACYLVVHDWRACDAKTRFPIDFDDPSVGPGFEYLRRHRLNVYRDGP